MQPRACWSMAVVAVVVVVAVVAVVACGSPTPRTSPQPEVTPATPRSEPATSEPVPTSERVPTSEPVPTSEAVPTSEPAWTPPAKSPPTTAPRAATSEKKPERCSIRLTERAIFVDGDAMERHRAVAVCKQRSTALVEVADGAKESDWKKLRTALVAAGVTIMMRGVREDQPKCLDNPLAKGCN